MKLPTIAQLDEVSEALHGMKFGPLPIADKLPVVHIAQHAVLAGVIDDLPVQLGIQFAECLVEYGPKIGKTLFDGLEAITGQLEEIDKSLAHPLEKIGEWFEKSRLYEP